MATAPSEEFCARPPILALWALYVLMVWSYAAGGVMIILSAAYVVLMLWGPIREPLLRTFSGSYVDVAHGLAVPATGTLMFVTGRLCQRAVRAGKDISLKVDASGIYVTDMFITLKYPHWRERRYTIDFAEINQLKTSKSFWLGTRIYLVLRSGRQYGLPQRIRTLDTLVEKIARSAGLDSHRREGGWEVYFRSEAVEREQLT